MLFGLLGSIIIGGNSALAQTEADAYNSAFLHGCSDSKKGGHPYLDENGGDSAQKSEFMEAYNEGYMACEAGGKSQVNRSEVCDVVDQYLLNPCSTYVNSDGALTSEGQRVKDCFKGGVLFGGGSQTLGNLLVPESGVEEGLKTAAILAGCDGIFDLPKLKQATDILKILKSFGKR
jgi:hypothetical protein